MILGHIRKLLRRSKIKYLKFVLASVYKNFKYNPAMAVSVQCSNINCDDILLREQFDNLKSNHNSLKVSII